MPLQRPSRVTPELAARLCYVRADPGCDLSRFPDFLIVGPQRTGTTWLHARLRFHPEIFLSEPKELFFFSRIKDRPPGKFQSDSLSWYLQFFRDRWSWWLYKTCVCLWRYRQLYRPKVRGEATASYAVLDDDVIQDIVTLNPRIKVILMVRDPVDRAWSHAKKDLARNRGRHLQEVDAREVAEFLLSPYQIRCAQYVANIQRWARHLQKGHVFVGLFDDISRHPTELLLQVMRFLGVNASARYLAGNVQEPVNPTPRGTIPDRYRQLLEEILQPELEALEREFGLSWRSAPMPEACRSFVYDR